MFLSHSKTSIVFLMTQTYRLAHRVMQEYILNSLIRLDTYQTSDAEYIYPYICIYTHIYIGQGVFSSDREFNLV